MHVLKDEGTLESWDEDGAASTMDRGNLASPLSHFLQDFDKALSLPLEYEHVFRLSPGCPLLHCFIIFILLITSRLKTDNFPRC